MPITIETIEVVQRAIVSLSVGSKNVYNVFHYRRSVTGTGYDLSNIAAAWLTAVQVPLAAALSADWTSVSVGVRGLEDATQRYLDTASGMTGAIAGDRLPLYNNVTVYLETGSRGRNYRGKKLFAPVAESDTVLDQISGVSPLARWNAVRAACIATFADADLNTWMPVVLSRNLSQLAINPTTVTRADITAALLNLTIGTCRHRKERTIR